MNKLNITHLVISGGGMHGVIFVGALRYIYLENLHKNITHISATSIGSYIGLMIAFKYNMDEIETIMYECFNNPGINHIPKKNYYKLITELGLCSSSCIIDNLKDILRKKHDNIEEITFKDLTKRFGVNMYISTTNINRCENTIFSIETTPDVSVFKACEASMSIPFLCKPVYINGEYYYDGALSNNFPIKVFENISQENILGMMLYNKNNDVVSNMNVDKISIFVIIKQMLHMMNSLRLKEAILRQVNEKDLDNYYIPDTILLQNFMSYKINKNGIYMDITEDQINEMIYSGFNSMYNYIHTRLKNVEKNQQYR